MTEQIGAIYPTAVPSLSDVADIQEALRVYHYGLPSGGADEPGKYQLSNQSRDELHEPSMAWHLNELQKEIDAFQAGLTPSAWTSKGALITATGVNPTTLTSLEPGLNTYILTANSGAPTGLEWLPPQVTLINNIRLENKELLNGSISSTGLRFIGPAQNNFATTLIMPTPTANKTVLFPESNIIPNATTTLVGTDTTQTLTNKSIAASQITGQLPVNRGGTGAETAAVARQNLEIFNAQTAVTAGTDRTPYSGKIFVVDPTVAGAEGQFLEGANQGDLWFW